MGKGFRDTLNERLKDPAFKAEWDALEPERRKARNEDLIMVVVQDGEQEHAVLVDCETGRPYDPIWDMYYDEFDDLEEKDAE